MKSFTTVLGAVVVIFLSADSKACNLLSLDAFEGEICSFMLDCHCLGEAEEECEEGQEQVELHNLRLYRIDLNLI
jgi:hypothetical protein